MAFRDDREAQRQRVLLLERELGEAQASIVEAEREIATLREADTTEHAELQALRKRVSKISKKLEKASGSRGTVQTVIIVAVLAAVGTAGVIASVTAGEGTTAEPRGERFRFGGSLERDTCDSRIGLASDRIWLDREGGTLYANRVDRTFPITWEGEVLHAALPYHGGEGCPEPAVSERWELRPTADGGFEGTLTADWSLPPRCDQPCEATFAVTLTPDR